jgi:hypothetical protein
MTNFDFHSTLNSIQFERLIRDILEIKYNGISFRTYASGRDEGIDVKCVDEDVKIICQTKLYQNRFSQLKASLKRDAKRLVKHKANRYIIATSCSLTNKNIQEIRWLFARHKIQLQENDIWDRELLNQWLQQPAYKPVLRTHFNLFLTDITVLETSLRDIVNNNILQRSIAELEKIQYESKYYVETKAARLALERVMKEKVVILTGTAGCGKTTTAKILINGLLNALSEPTQFIKLRNIGEAEHIIQPDKQQIFLFDDYWGQFTDEVHEHHAGNRSALPDFIERISGLKSHYLIITSRDYIIENEGIQKQAWLKTLIEKHRLIIRLGTFEPQERAHLFIRHLYCSNYSRDYFTSLFFRETVDKIVNHVNFNPRIVCDFIDSQFDIIQKENPYTNVNDFYSHLERHLNAPQLFWHNLIKAQNDAGRLLLFILVISSGNNTQEEIHATFEKCVGICQGKGIQVSVKDYKEAMRLLEDGFIELQPLPNSNSWNISFKNGSIADAVIAFLQKESREWIPILLQGALFFNQLTQNFTTYTNMVTPDKIILDNKDKSILIDRLLKEFMTLYDHAGDLAKSDFTSLRYVERLYHMPLVFDLQLDVSVREFLITQADTINKSIIINPRFFSRRDINFLPYLCINIKNWFQINGPVFLLNIFFHISHFRDYENFIIFQGASPKVFEQFLADYKERITSHIKKVIISNAAGITEKESNLMPEVTYKKILEILQLKHSKSLEAELSILGIQYPSPSIKKPVMGEIHHEEKDNDALKNSFAAKHDFYLEVLQQYVGSINSYAEDDFPSRSIAAMNKFHQRKLDEICLLNSNINRKELDSFLRALALDGDEWYTEPALRRLWKERTGIDFSEQLDLTPAFWQREKWFRLGGGYVHYLVALYCKEDVADAGYYDTLNRILDDADFQNFDILTFIHKIDPERFVALLMTPHINAFLKDIDFTDEKSITLSCCNSTEWETNFYINKEKGKYTDMELYGCGGGVPHAIEVFTAMFGIEEHFFSLSEDLVYMIKKLKKKDRQLFNDFAAYCDHKSLLEDKERKEVGEDDSFGYDLKVSKELTNPEFYAMAERCGWVAKLANIIRTLHQVAQGQKV